MSERNIIILFILLLMLINLDMYSLKLLFRPQQKIILVYNPDSGFGFGDYIRGIMHAMQNVNYSKIYINYEYSNIGKYLYNSCNNTYHNSEPVNKLISKDYVEYSNEKNFLTVINNKPNSDEIFLSHNGALKYPIEPWILKQARKMFVPRKNLQTLIDKTLEKFPKEFITLHIRLSDHIFTKDKLYKIDKIDKFLTDNSNNNIYILSNSVLTKNYYAKKFNCISLDLKPIHTDPNVNKEYKTSEEINTLLEFFIMSHSSTIYQYCENPNQTSGFSQRTSELFEIPFIKII